MGCARGVGRGRACNLAEAFVVGRWLPRAQPDGAPACPSAASLGLCPATLSYGFDLGSCRVVEVSQERRAEMFATAFRFPLDDGYKLTQGYNGRFVEGKFHLGEDWSNKASGGSVYSVAYGKVKFAYHHTNLDGTPGFGNLVIVEHPLSDGRIITSIYSHLQSINVKQNDEVGLGHIIGLVGNTGFSTGPHLHFALAIDGEVGRVPLAYVDDEDLDITEGYVSPTWFFPNFKPPGVRQSQCRTFELVASRSMKQQSSRASRPTSASQCEMTARARPRTLRRRAFTSRRR